jgi:hypothetical protein
MPTSIAHGILHRCDGATPIHGFRSSPVAIETVQSVLRSLSATGGTGKLFVHTMGYSVIYQPPP